MTNVDGTDWDNATSIKRVPAANEEEVSERFRAGERFHEFEGVRLFMKYGTRQEAPDFYSRLSNKLRKKLGQTKIKAGTYGKLVFIEVPADLRLADKAKLEKTIADVAKHSKTTLGVVLANREANPHYRHHYSLLGSLNRIGFALKPELISIFDRFTISDSRIDPLTRLSYQSSWEEARSRVRANREKPD